MTSITQTEREENLSRLRELLPMAANGERPTAVYTIIRHVTRSGSASVSVVIVDESGEPVDISWLAARVLRFRMDPVNGGLKVDYMGERRDAALIHDLARVLHGSSTALNQVAL